MGVTISVRVDDEIKKEIEELGYTPSEYIQKNPDSRVEERAFTKSSSMVENL